MTLKVDMSEVYNMKNAIQKELHKTDGDLDTLKGSLTALVETKQFEGATATNVKNYTNSFHNKTIVKFKQTNENFIKDVTKSINKFSSEVDSSKFAILDEVKIRDYEKDIKSKIKAMRESIEFANFHIDVAGSLTTAQKIGYKQLETQADAFRSHVKTTLEHLTDFDAMNSIDGDLTNNTITELKSLTSYVRRDLPTQRSTIKGTSQKIERAIKIHKTKEEIVRWQEFLEKKSDYTNSLPPHLRKGLKAFKQAGREMLALKAIGNGDALAGYNEFMKVRNIDKIIDNMPKKQLQKMALFMHTDIDNIKLKNLLKGSGEFVKNNPFRKGNLVNWMTNVQEYNSKSSELLKNELKDKNFQYKFGDSKKFFDTAEMKKAASTEFKNTFSSKNFREYILKTENFKSKTAAAKNIKTYVDEGLKTLKGDFASKNVLGKLRYSMKVGGKVLKPLAIAATIADNMDEKKSTQEKIVGMGVDLGAIGASAAAGAAIGTAIPVPVLGTLVGAAGGILVGALLEMKLPGANKSVIDLTKEGINKGIDKGVEVFKRNLSVAEKGFKLIFR
ncbi:T7SS effector LXG polymorphic toxin [Staphylococcus lutrae]|uniref:Transposase n=1 Tax=Staphylococcus lutrae TaxID=155085 RepID=A0AAC9WJA2_9STAP|nr:T7SS effector LXG polymorphic toxin [Staphylococcus lutrae]ARJ51000.1 transposase [Staphylococcus lutrae]